MKTTHIWIDKMTGTWGVVSDLMIVESNDQALDRIGNMSDSERIRMADIFGHRVRFKKREEQDYE